ncbi:hypothetical protein [Phenylobacterium sp.]|jgi:hypothetical protein|uniref:hypothetical protein n=1 Tax=Phenylobacterium sp. TaxID=1871053 RepID=UPI002F3F0433
MDDMSFFIAVVIAVVAVVAIAIALIAMRSSRRGRLHRMFGPEYARAVEAAGGDKAVAEAELSRRLSRVRAYHLHGLSNGQKRRYAESWAKVQAEFVDDPHAAVRDADKLLGDILQARGYPLTGFDQQAEDLSVAHPKVVEDYRAAHAIALREDEGDAATEDLRQAMVHCRVLYEDLVGARARRAQARGGTHHQRVAA